MASPAKLTLLVVDDEPDVLDSLVLLVQSGRPDVVVLTAQSAAEAERLAREHRLDVVLTDYRMPRMNGIEFLERLRRIKPDVPRVLMTAYAEPRILASAVNRAQIDRLLLKPFEPVEAQEILYELLLKRRGSTGRIPPPDR